MTFIRSPIPATRMMTGTRTGGGMARRNSSTGSANERSHRFEPISTPTLDADHEGGRVADGEPGEARQDIGASARRRTRSRGTP